MRLEAVYALAAAALLLVAQSGCAPSDESPGAGVANLTQGPGSGAVAAPEKPAPAAPPTSSGDAEPAPSAPSAPSIDPDVKSPKPPVWSGTAKSFVLEASGTSFFGPNPPGSNCVMGSSKTTFDVATRTLASTFCKFVDDTTPMLTTTVTKVLASKDVEQLNGVLLSLARAKDPQCTPDIGTATLGVTTDTGSQTYVDALTAACSQDQVDAIALDPLFDIVAKLRG